MLLSLPRDPVELSLVTAANDLLQTVAEFVRDLKSVKDPLKASELARNLKETLAKQDSPRVKQSMERLQSYVEADPNYLDFLSSRAERTAAKARERLAKNRTDLKRLAAITLEIIQEDITSDNSAKLSKIYQSINSVTETAGQDVVDSILQYALAELRNLGLEKKIREMGLVLNETAAANKVAALTTNQRRVALVIGNSNYRRGGALLNPVNDARAIANTLRQFGFEVWKDLMPIRKL